MAVYSTSFILADIEGGASATFDVPAGFVAIVRDVSSFSLPPGPAELLVSVNGVGCISVNYESAGTGLLLSGHWEGRLVLPLGATLTASPTGLAGVAISGYLLTS